MAYPASHFRHANISETARCDGPGENISTAVGPDVVALCASVTDIPSSALHLAMQDNNHSLDLL